MNLRISWLQNGAVYKKVEGSISNVIAPPKGIYNVGLDKSGWFLEYFAKEFTFNYKIYGLESDFVDHVLKSYNNTFGNFGILLNGVKGTGKSVTAKIIANKMNLPIVIVKDFGDANASLIEFLSGFNFDCIFFFDEFEKNFKENDTSILQIMDGAYTSDFRRIFLLTTNETKINDNLISRPSRLRYIHEFGNLKKDIAEEYLRDNLKDKSCIDRIINFIDTLQISTMDILKSICEEINIFGIEEFLRTKNYFNIKKSTFSYSIIQGSYALDSLKTNFPNYNFDSFLEDCELYKLRESRSSDSKCEMPTLYMNRSYLFDIEKPFKNWKEGDNIKLSGDSCTIAKIDIKRNVALLIEDIDSYLHFVKILNPNTKPSIFNSLTNPYSDIF